MLGFLNDSDENIRILAARNIPIIKDDSIIEHVIQMAKHKGFKDKNEKEIESILEILARSKTEKAYESLKKIIGKLSFFSGSKNTVIGLCAIESLKAVDNPESRKILKKGSRSKNKKIKEASDSALQQPSQTFDQKGLYHD